MLVVADASILVTALTTGARERIQVQRWLVELTGDQPVHVVRNLTNLEYLSAIRNLSLQQKLSERHASIAIRAFIDLPSRRMDVTQAMASRIWEMRHNLTAYDAAYVALAERMQSEYKDDVVVATDDARLARAPGVLVAVRSFPR
ncbi:MAG: type II toxin-antitoxin system VapC family toxin [Microthrixaceae bacterium]|nr:type II toxin-antitoxin system VapC family toxin [Microthrixaceae bacterium]